MKQQKVNKMVNKIPNVIITMELMLLLIVFGCRIYQDVFSTVGEEPPKQAQVQETTTEETVKVIENMEVPLKPYFNPIEPPKTKSPAIPHPNLEIPLDDDLQSYTYHKCDYDIELYCLAISVMFQESSFNPDAVSKDGHDHGLMQLRDSFYSELIEKYDIEDPKEPMDNITAGIGLLKDYLEKYEYKNLALMCYNEGEYGAKQKWKEGVYSTDYTVKVLNHYKEFLALAKAEGKE